MSEKPIFIITRGINDDLVDFAYSLEDAFNVVADRFTADEILLQVIEIKTLVGEIDIDKLSSCDVYAMMKEQGYYSE